MKKIILLTLTIILLITSTKSVFCEEFIYGDFNNDKKVNSKDYAYLKRYVANQIPYYEITSNTFFNSSTYRVYYSLKAGDVNADGVIDQTDIAVLRAFLLGKSNTLPSNVV